MVVERGRKWGEIKSSFFLRNKNQTNAKQSIKRTFAPYCIKTVLTYVKISIATLLTLTDRTPARLLSKYTRLNVVGKGHLIIALTCIAIYKPINDTRSCANTSYCLIVEVYKQLLNDNQLSNIGDHFPHRLLAIRPNPGHILIGIISIQEA